jgi:asparagine synthase (glutamine-hydrolysing)
VARELLPEDKRLKTFSAIFDIVKECDERPYINAVLAQGELEPYFVHADEIGPLTDINKMLWHEDQPFFAPNLFMHWALYSAANQQQVRVLLDGIDGDTTVSHGRAYLTELARRGQLISLSREVKGYSRNFGTSPWRIINKRVISPFIPEFMLGMMRAFRGETSSKVTNLDREFVMRIGLDERLEKLEGDRLKLIQTSRGDHWRHLTSGLLSVLLEIADMAASAFFIEPRNPFFDKRLMEFCLAIPPEQKIRRGWTRWIMRRALKGILPEEVRCRGGKSTLAPNFRHGLLTLDGNVLETFVNNPNIIGDYVDICTLRETYQIYASSGGRCHSGEMMIWSSIPLAIWLASVNNMSK